MSRGLPKNQKNLLDKAKESALLAIEIYNKPLTNFRIGGFIVLMIVAWTSLLHSIFEKNGKKYFYKDKKSKRYLKIDGEKKAWEIDKCINEYFNGNNPIKSNIQLFIGLRNKIEHRFMPNIDDAIVGECQALILNFEKILNIEFGDKYNLIDKIFIPLQISNAKRTIKPCSKEKNVLEFIENFRNKLDKNIYNSSEYSYRMFLIPKIANHLNTSDIAIEFIKFDPNNPEEMEKYEHLIVGIKEKTIQVANQGKYRPKFILEKLNKLGYNDNHVKEGNKLNIHWHTKMWKKYKIRRKKGESNCDTKYCQLDNASTQKDFIYTEDWVKLLIDKELYKLK